MDSWKNFNLKYKWMPSSYLISKFGLQKYDIDNFRRKDKIRKLLDPWKISLSQKPDRLRVIFEQAWEYCLRDDYNIDITTPRHEWIPKLLAVKNVSRSSSGFGFLTNSRYLNIICPKSLEDYKLHGFTNVALGAFHFWPGEVLLKKNGVMPFMFYQTHKKAVDMICIEDMIEHVYLAFFAEKDGSDPRLAKEIFFARHDEQQFIRSKDLAKYGIPQNFYQAHGGLRVALSRIAEKYASELDYVSAGESVWFSSEFRNKYPNKNLDKCKYCGLSPVDLHHFLPRSDFPTLAYHPENVVPLCIQSHGLITRNKWSSDLRDKYVSAIRMWRAADEGKKVDVFNQVMNELHDSIYGYIEKA